MKIKKTNKVAIHIKECDILNMPLENVTENGTGNILYNV